MNMMSNAGDFTKELPTTGLTTEINRISRVVTLWKRSMVDLPESKQKAVWSELIRETEQAIEWARRHAAAITITEAAERI